MPDTSPSTSSGSVFKINHRVLIRDPEARIPCEGCHEKFRSKNALLKHRRLKHPRQFSLRTPTLECPACSARCESMQQLCEHVAGSHDRRDLVIVDFMFDSFRQFESWREQHESDECVKFTKVSGRLRSESSTEGSGTYHRYYQCHLSGPTSRTSRLAPDAPRMRNRRSKKMGSHCTAFMTIRINEQDGRVFMKGCLTHFGHPIDPSRLPMPASLRQHIVDLFAAGLDEHAVYDNIKSQATNQDDRAYHLKRYEVKNVMAKLLRQQQQLIYEQPLVISPTADAVPVDEEDEHEPLDEVKPIENGKNTIQACDEEPEAEAEEVVVMSIAEETDFMEEVVVETVEQPPSSVAVIDDDWSGVLSTRGRPPQRSAIVPTSRSGSIVPAVNFNLSPESELVEVDDDDDDDEEGGVEKASGAEERYDAMTQIVLRRPGRRNGGRQHVLSVQDYSDMTPIVVDEVEVIASEDQSHPHQFGSSSFYETDESALPYEVLDEPTAPPHEPEQQQHPQPHVMLRSPSRRVRQSSSRRPPLLVDHDTLDRNRVFGARKAVIERRLH